MNPLRIKIIDPGVPGHFVAASLAGPALRFPQEFRSDSPTADRFPRGLRARGGATSSECRSRLSSGHSVHGRPMFFRCHHAYSIMATAVTPPMTNVTASPQFEGAMPAITRYIRPRISTRSQGVKERHVLEALPSPQLVQWIHQHRKLASHSVNNARRNLVK